MSIHAFPPPATHGLEAVVARAGGVVASRHGRAVAVNFGSAAGELAACVTAVGLADRSDLVKLELEGPQRVLAHVLANSTGSAPAPGGAVCTGSAWWCAAGPERVVVLSQPAGGERLRASIARFALRHPSLRIRERSDEWGTIAIVGARAGDVLAQLGVYGEQRDPRSVAPVTTHPVGSVDVLWLLQSDRRALAVMPLAEAPAVWRTVHRAGRPLGICAVGQEAIARYSLLARADREL
ncbi:MAG: hypothetical protein ACR2NR_16580 [Solirubrobacteraceae bacterium]